METLLTLANYWRDVNADSTDMQIEYASDIISMLVDKITDVDTNSVIEQVALITKSEQLVNEIVAYEEIVRHCKDIARGLLKAHENIAAGSGLISGGIVDCKCNLCAQAKILLGEEYVDQ